MNKRHKEILFEGKDLAEGFLRVFKLVQEEYEDRFDKIDNAEKLAHMQVEKEFEKKKKSLERHEKKIINELNDYLTLVEKYSTFKIDEFACIVDVLSDITSLYMGEEYVFDEVTFNNISQLLFYPKTLNINNDVCKKLINDGKILTFVDDQLDDERLNFYEAHKMNDIRALYPVGLRVSNNSMKYNFILEFIDLVVKYRMEKQSDDISFVELKRLEQAFIYSKKEEIDALNRKRSQEEREELEKKIEERDALLDKYIDDNFDFIDELPSEVALGNVTSGRVLRKLIETYNETCEE